MSQPRKLRFCPFCGSEAIEAHNNIQGSQIIYFVECEECLTSGPCSTNKLIAEYAWNNRFKELPDNESLSKLTSQPNPK